MFDVGFSELIMVGLVSLLVIGPERLPKVARVAGYWLGKMQQMIANVKVEIAQELHAEEIRQLLKANQEIDFNDDDKTTVDALPPKTEKINTSEKTHE
ncbi:MAG: Sec-independent protein translocase protein TatB [Methylococcales bacterium]|nr:Sec-independent protein translocase protein TatB [Methylococcales bacterium]